MEKNCPMLVAHASIRVRSARVVWGTLRSETILTILSAQLIMKWKQGDRLHIHGGTYLWTTITLKPLLFTARGPSHHLWNVKQNAIDDLVDNNYHHATLVICKFDWKKADSHQTVYESEVRLDFESLV